MLGLRQERLILRDTILAEEVRTLKGELPKIGRWLDDERFMEPFLKKFHTRIGRPIVPEDTYLRLMFLKFQYQLGCETFVAEVQDSITWRLFCRIPHDFNQADQETRNTETKPWKNSLPFLFRKPEKNA